MKRISVPALMKRLVYRNKGVPPHSDAFIRLSLPPELSGLWLTDQRLEKLIRHLAHRVSTAVAPGDSVRIAVRRRSKMRSLERFFKIRPAHWLLLKFVWRGSAGFEGRAQELMADLGFRCEEWIGMSGSWPQLGAYSLGRGGSLKLVFWAQWHRNIQRCDLLIPVIHEEGSLCIHESQGLQIAG